MDYFRDVNRDNVIVSRYCAPRGKRFVEVTWTRSEWWRRYAHRVGFVQHLTCLHDLVWIRVTTNGGRFRVWTYNEHVEKED